MSIVGSHAVFHWRALGQSRPQNRRCTSGTKVCRVYRACVDTIVTSPFPVRPRCIQDISISQQYLAVGAIRSFPSMLPDTRAPWETDQLTAIGPRCCSKTITFGTCRSQVQSTLRHYHHRSRARSVVLEQSSCVVRCVRITPVKRRLYSGAGGLALCSDRVDRARTTPRYPCCSCHRVGVVPEADYRRSSC